ncbi:MAG: malto-oligosyltrehalose synthase [Pegethrix bostrychoides GSE-TBD4-15B]|uniref:Malto-oligosyltrehalose synthase n=1 Tax=Pegethrix bostrychoides GSE-TBD4-15B TaxID=2839662 RepID=A0A951PAH3_9CYAN|nr:malto-oligosyltrehalose synthase [Pegethrix bostrychoides GSE-TBD4-15B]
MKIPLATYRIQFHAGFNFRAAQAIVPYLAELGISDLYASPIFTARTGSTHGYDVVNPGQINPELGGESEFAALSAELTQAGIGWIQDIVPNHMAFDSQNDMLVDVLENGPDSPFHNFFDIDWNHFYGGIKGRLLAPFLGRFYGDCLENGELQLRYDQEGLSVNYYNWRFPLRIETYSNVLMYDLARLREQLGRNHPSFVKLLGALYMLKYVPAGEESRERYDQISFVKQMLWELWNDSPEVQQFIEENIQILNGEPGKPESYNLLDALLCDQFFRLSYWKVGNEELNYRRFFTVNELISLKVEDQAVFDTIHAYVFVLIREGKINGLRIDHIDGLYDPTEYIKRIRQQMPDLYLVVEKILESNEDLPLNWSIQGTTGYDFMNKVNGLFCQQEHKAEFTNLYSQFIGSSTSCETLIDQNKRLIIGKHMTGDIDNLAHLLNDLSDRYRYASDFTMYGLKRALVEILALFPVYRTYISREGSRKADQEMLTRVIANAKENNSSFTNELYFIEKFMTLEFDEHLSAEDRDQWLHFIMRLQQYTGPLMAKGIEDTVMYVYNRLLSLNEVGSAPCEFGVSVEEFHAYNQSRAQQWPHAMNATATHDTKRGEDARARLNVLSELPQEWQQQIRHWSELNEPTKVLVNGRAMPDRNAEYFLYQTLLGAFPFDPADYPQFIERVKDYIIKASREAKVYTSWQRSDQEYETAFLQFIDQICKPESIFLEAFQSFQRKVQHYGIFNSLSQTLLKIASPGVPDFYQGAELWDLSLVDPDNRRPVDYEKRWNYLQAIKSSIENDLPSLMAELLQNPDDGRIKLFLIYQVLKARRAQPDLFQRGSYESLTVVGSLKPHVVAFTRMLGNQQAMIIVPRLLTALIPVGELPLGEQVWHETRILQPPVCSTVWQDAISGQVIQGEDTLWLKDILSQFPVALLLSEVPVASKPSATDVAA